MHLNAIADGLDAAGLTVERLWATPSRMPRLMRLLTFQALLMPRLGALDLLYCRWHVLGLPLLLAARVARVPYILEVNGSHEDIVLAYPGLRRFRALLLALSTWEFRHAHAVITVAPGLAAWIEQLTSGRVPVEWMPNGAPDALSGRSTAPDDPPYAVFIGELARWQGLDTLLAARRSSSWPAGVSLVIAGSGVGQPLVEQCSTEGVVDFRGRLPRDAAQELLARGSVSISPQTARLDRNLLGVTPLKVAESVMLGVPPVVSDLPGQADIVRSAPAGAVVPPDDPEALATAVGRVIAGVADRVGLSAYGRRTLGWETIARRTFEVCCRALERG